MVKKLLLLALLILTFYAGYRVVFPSNNLSNDNLDIIIPEGKEETYNKIVSDIKKEFRDKKTKKHTKVKAKKTIKENYKEVSYNNDKILLKIKGREVKGENLFATFYLYNNTSSKINKRIFINCKGLDKNKREVDSFSWSGNLKLNSKKTSLIKDLDLGIISNFNIKNITCEAR